MPLVSYAQNREDVLLHRALSGQPKGFYIDVGANDPTVFSITQCFYQMGWHGINIEPVPNVFRRLAAERTRDVNLNVGISNREGTLRFYECLSESTLSTFSPAVVKWWSSPPRGFVFEERQVPVMTLAEVCAQHAQDHIDFLSIDAETHESEVIEGHDWKRWRPRIVVIEDGISPDTGRKGHEVWEAKMLAADYRFGFFDGVNRFYVRKEEEQLLPLLQVPVNPTDGYVTYEWTRLTKEVARLHSYAELEGLSLTVARKLRDLSRRHPRMSAAAKRLVRYLLGTNASAEPQAANASQPISPS